MPFYHTKCGGDISFWRRRCKKCGKKWGIVAFFVTDSSVRPGKSFEKAAKTPKRKPTSYAKWGDRWLGVPTVASHLPNWPKWARVLTTLCFFGGIVFLVLWLVIL